MLVARVHFLPSSVPLLFVSGYIASLFRILFSKNVYFIDFVTGDFFFSSTGSIYFRSLFYIKPDGKKIIKKLASFSL